MPTKTPQSETQKVPKLRFAGFEGGWEEKKLGIAAEFWNGKAHEQDISEDGKYIVVNSKFISQNGNVKKYSETQISPLKKDDIVIVMSDIPNGKAIGKCFLVDKDNLYTLNQRIGAIKSKEIISPFLLRILNRNKYFLKFDNGVSQTNLRKDEVLGCPIVFPPIPEQQKIARFLGGVDEWIENLRSQKESLESYKKGMMQKIFSQGIRFKDGEGNKFPKWEEKKLGEVADFYKGNGISKDDIIEGGQNKCIRYGELYTEYSEIISEVKSRTNVLKTEGFLSKENDIIIPSSGETALDIASVACVKEGAILLGGDLNVIRLQENQNGEFFAYYLTHFQNIHIARLAQGNSVVHLYASHLKTLRLSLPSFPEQQKIAEFLTSVDKVLESKQQQITQAEQWKKGLMQQLFI